MGIMCQQRLGVLHFLSAQLFTACSQQQRLLHSSPLGRRGFWPMDDPSLD
jgi:hypothetical protein